MPKLSGLFDNFDNLDQIDINYLISWLKNAPTPTALENYLANKILYPTTIPQTEADIKIDLAILREALRLNGPKNGQAGGPLLGDNPFLNITLRKMIIPERFLYYIPDLVTLTWVFVDGLLLSRKRGDIFEDLWTVVVADDIDEIVGSVLLPKFDKLDSSMKIFLMGKDFQIKAGSLTRVPCPKMRCEISYKFSAGEVLGKQINSVEVYGGRLGLMIDGRMQ